MSAQTSLAVGPVEQPGQERALLPGRVRHRKGADQAMVPVNAEVVMEWPAPLSGSIKLTEPLEEWHPCRLWSSE